MRRSTILGILVLVPAAFAQTANPIGYPADTLRAGSGNLLPFGFSTSPNFDEGRWQQLIPARLLPTTAGLITGIAANCQNTNVALKYSTYRIQLSHTTATTLGSTFSGNLPAPVTVLNATDLTVTWAINTWVVVNFTTPFVYNGTDNLVVSLTKVYDRVTNPVTPAIVTHQTTGSPHRTDLVATAYAGSTFGGGGSTTDTVQFTSTAVLSMRLLSTTQGTTTIASVTQPQGREFSLGTTAQVTVWAANGTLWGTLLDTAFRGPVSLGFIAGLMRVNPTFLIATGTTSGGSSVINIPIPNDPAFVGSYWVLQSVTATPTLLAFTNALDFFVTM